MKLDIKSILILVLLGFSLVFGFMWYFRGDYNSKIELEKLQKRYDDIELEKEKSDIRLIDNAKVIDSLLLEDSLNVEKIKILEFNVNEAEKKANITNMELIKMKNELIETRRKIDVFKKDPPDRTGDDLLNSIKNKTK